MKQNLTKYKWNQGLSEISESSESIEMFCEA